MLAVDTDLIIRYLVRDDDVQSERARAIIDRADFFVCTTVLLETEWVLRYRLKLDDRTIARTLRNLAGLAQARLEDPLRLAKALDWMEAGMDFADALHLAAAEGCEAFLSFDKDCAKVAKQLNLTLVRAP